MSIPLTRQPGRVGRVSYSTGRQRQRVGQLLDLGDPAAAWAAALSYQRKFADRALRLDVLPSADFTWKTATLEEFELRDYQHGLAGASASTPTAPAPLFDMPPQPQHQQYPPLTFAAQQAPSMTEPPTNMDSYGQFLFRQQGHLLQESRMKVLQLEGQLQTQQQQQQALKEQLDTANMDLRHKDREHELSLKEARRDIRDELEGDMKPAKGGGLGGLLEAANDPNSPLAGILGVLASKLLGNGGAPAAAPAPAGPAGEMGQVVAGIAELLPDTDTAAKVYAALARILPHPDGLTQLLNLAGI